MCSIKKKECIQKGEKLKSNGRGYENCQCRDCCKTVKELIWDMSKRIDALERVVEEWKGIAPALAEHLLPELRAAASDMVKAFAVQEERIQALEESQRNASRLSALHPGGYGSFH